MNFLKKYFLFLIFIFSFYVALTIGKGWDEGYYYELGKITFNYIFSFGNIDKEITFREFFSPSLWTFQYFLSLIFPLKYKVQIFHVINFVFSLSAVYGIKKITKILFDDHVAKATFVFLILLPVFFGHMFINPKDIFLASCHVWIFYYLLKYLIYNEELRPKKITIKIASLIAIGTGIQILFIGSLIPLIVFFVFEAFFFKKILKSKIKLKFFLNDLIFLIVLSYSILTIFWIDSHQNIFLEQFKIIKKLFTDYQTGWPFNNLNGNYFFSSEVPFFYILVQIFFKFPEYLIFLIFLFIYYFIFRNNVFSLMYKNFNYKIIFIIIFALYSSAILFFINFPVYDGIRLFFWSIPYFMIPPALVFSYSFKNKSSFKLLNFLTLSLFVYFLFNFISITPYQYTYLNSFTGDKYYRYKKFENDYWAVSLNELIDKFNFGNDKFLNLNTCGVDSKLIKEIFYKKKISNYEFNSNNSEFIIMTNRSVNSDDTFKKITNCYDKFPGEDVYVVERNGVILSTFRKIN